MSWSEQFLSVFPQRLRTLEKLQLCDASVNSPVSLNIAPSTCWRDAFVLVSRHAQVVSWVGGWGKSH